MKNLRKQISDFCALVFTHCETRNDSANQEFLITNNTALSSFPVRQLLWPKIPEAIIENCLSMAIHGIMMSDF